MKSGFIYGWLYNKDMPLILYMRQYGNNYCVTSDKTLATIYSSPQACIINYLSKHAIPSDYSGFIQDGHLLIYDLKGNLYHPALFLENSINA